MSNHETPLTPTLQLLQHLLSVAFSLNRYFTCQSPWLTVSNSALLNWPQKGTKMPSGSFRACLKSPRRGRMLVLQTGMKWGCFELPMVLQFRMQRKVFSPPQESREGSNVEMTVELKLTCFPVYCTSVRNFNLKFSFPASYQTHYCLAIYL